MVVSNATTGNLLEGAEVSIPALGLRTITNRDGSFTFTRVPAGSQGLEPQTSSVDVRADAVVEPRVALGEGAQQLEAFVVSSTRQGEAASITKQRNAPNVVNVVAIDTFGDVADGNIGNFMVRLPGVSAEETSNGDIIGIEIRVTPAELSSVNLDGVRVSNAVSGFSPMGDRATMIDHLPAEFIKEIEVHKALIPSMPADAIGGATNLITKSALDFRESVLTYKFGASYNTYRDSLGNFKPTATLSYMTKVGRERPIGVTLSLSYSVTEMPRDRMSVTRPDPDGRMGQARPLAEINTRERAGAGLKFEHRFDANTTVSAKFNYAYYHYEGMREISAASSTGNRLPADYNIVSRAQIEAGTIPRTTTNAAAGVGPGFSDAYTEMLNATWTNEMGRVVRYARNYLGEVTAERKLSSDQKLNFHPSWFDADLPTFVTTLTNGNTTAAAGIGMEIDARQNRLGPYFDRRTVRASLPVQTSISTPESTRPDAVGPRRKSRTSSSTTPKSSPGTSPCSSSQASIGASSTAGCTRLRRAGGSSDPIVWQCATPRRESTTTGGPSTSRLPATVSSTTSTRRATNTISWRWNAPR